MAGCRSVTKTRRSVRRRRAGRKQNRTGSQATGTKARGGGEGGKGGRGKKKKKNWRGKEKTTTQTKQKGQGGCSRPPGAQSGAGGRPRAAPYGRTAARRRAASQRARDLPQEGGSRRERSPRLPEAAGGTAATRRAATDGRTDCLLQAESNAQPSDTAFTTHLPAAAPLTQTSGSAAAARPRTQPSVGGAKGGRGQGAGWRPWSPGHAGSCSAIVWRCKGGLCVGVIYEYIQP